MVNAALKHEVEEILEHLPETATLGDLLIVLQTQAASQEEERTMIAQERDPHSALRQALNRALAQSDAGEGREHETIRRRFVQ